MASVHLKMGLVQCSMLYLPLFFLTLAQSASWRNRDIVLDFLSLLESWIPEFPPDTTLVACPRRRGKQSWERRPPAWLAQGPTEPTIRPDQEREQRGFGDPMASWFPCSCAASPLWPCSLHPPPGDGTLPRNSPSSPGPMAPSPHPLGRGWAVRFSSTQCIRTAAVPAAVCSKATHPRWLQRVTDQALCEDTGPCRAPAERLRHQPHWVATSGGDAGILSLVLQL